jgi:peptidoglycan/xylan/chitin deacetylase (PgdA/CDA1 family)
MMDRNAVNVCFHGIGEPQRALEPDEDGYWVSLDAFQRILDEVSTWPSTTLSFDDGNASDIELALPRLEERGLRATFFVLAGRLDQPGSLSTSDVAVLAQRGMGIGTHGMEHRSWRRMEQAEARSELVEARDQIAAAAGMPVTEAALPFGLYDRRALSQLREAGYERVLTSDRRHAKASGWIQPRFSVVRGETPESLRQKVDGAARRHRRASRALVCCVKRWR